MARRETRTPYADDPRDPLELMARLLVSGGYKVPVEGRSTASLGVTSADIAGAVGYMRNPLERQTALTVATRGSDVDAARLASAAYREIVREVRKCRPIPIDLTDGADRWRLRIAIYDATRDLIWPERREPLATLAKAAKTRRSTYAVLHRCATAVLQAALADARLAFRRSMFHEA